MSRATARAHANIAVAKYWGKADESSNLPAVPSVSVTLAALTTTTTVVFDERLDADELVLDGVAQRSRSLERVSRLLDRVRDRARLTAQARVISTNDFPTASGLASSASAFAALALAATTAAGLAETPAWVSDLARRSSASAARSVFGGFVRLRAGAPGSGMLCAEPLAAAEHWDLRVVIAVNTQAPKSVGSTDGMLHTQRTSPYYGAWVEICERTVEEVEAAVAARDIRRLGEAAEHSALAMHASAMAARPGVLYFEPATVACLRTVAALRAGGVAAYATMDAGPHVKVFTLPEHVAQVESALRATPGVLRTIASTLGGPAVVVGDEEA